MVLNCFSLVFTHRRNIFTSICLCSHVSTKQDGSGAFAAARIFRLSIRKSSSSSKR